VPAVGYAILRGRWTNWAKITTVKISEKIAGKRWIRVTRIRTCDNPTTMIAMKAQAKAADFSAVFFFHLVAIP